MQGRLRTTSFSNLYSNASCTSMAARRILRALTSNLLGIGYTRGAGLDSILKRRYPVSCACTPPFLACTNSQFEGMGTTEFKVYLLATGHISNHNLPPSYWTCRVPSEWACGSKTWVVCAVLL